MAQSFIDKYVFALMLDSSNFEKGANVATKAVNGIKSTILKTYSMIGGIDLFKSMVSDYTNTARSIDNLNLITGENITTLQAWNKSIQDVGGNVGAFQGTLRGLSQSLTDLRNFGKYDERIGWLGAIGVDLYKDGRLKKASELLTDIAGKIKGMGETEAWSWARRLGIDESTYRLFRKHGDQIERIIKNNEKYAVLKRGDIKTLEEYDRMISNFKNSWTSFSREIMSSVLPVIQKDLFPEVEKLVKYLTTNKGEVGEFFSTFSKGLITVFQKTNKVMGLIGSKVGEVQGALESGNFDKAGQTLFDVTPFGMAVNWLKGNVADWAKNKQANSKQNFVVIQNMNVETKDAKRLSKDLQSLAESYPVEPWNRNLMPQFVRANNK